jgi:hypothetical protein
MIAALIFILSISAFEDLDVFPSKGAIASILNFNSTTLGEVNLSSAYS